MRWIGFALLGLTLVLPAAFSGRAQECFRGACAANANGIVNANLQNGGDGCAKIQASWNTLPAQGGVVDARQLTGTQTCASNPFDGLTKAGETLIGPTTYQTSATWVIAAKSILRGIGRGDAQSTNSVIQAASNLSGPVLQLASGSSAEEGVRAEDLTVDCNNNDNSTGVLDNVAQEESGLEHVMILGCTNKGLDIEDGSQNSSFNDVEVLSAGANTSTHPVMVNTRGPLRGIHGLTINTWGAPYPDVAMQIGSMGSYTDMHCEGAATCFYVTADNVTLINIECGPNVRVCIAVAPTVRNLTIMGAFNSTPGGIIISDRATSNVLSSGSEGPGVGWYSIGGDNPRTVCSSSAHVGCTFRMRSAEAQPAAPPAIPPRPTPIRRLGFPYR